MYRHKCPDCKGPAKVRTSREITVTFRQQTIACLDPECGGTYGGDFTITHRISPSAMPDASLQLRTAPPRRRADNDNLPGVQVIQSRGPEVPSRPANDGDTHSEAVATGG